VVDFHTPLTSSTLDNIKIVYGAAVARELIDLEIDSDIDITNDNNAGNNNSLDDDFMGKTVNNNDNGLHQPVKLKFSLKGKISNANYSCKKSVCIIFINNRLVDCSSLRKVIESIYSDLLPRYSHPFIYLSLSMPPEHIDVNVHPCKKEVHFMFENELMEAIYTSVSNKLKSSNDSRTFYTQSLLLQNQSGYLISHLDDSKNIDNITTITTTTTNTTTGDNDNCNKDKDGSMLDYGNDNSSDSSNEDNEEGIYLCIYLSIYHYIYLTN
jgi:DNA mismatch repair ATPase MutL